MRWMLLGALVLIGVGLAAWDWRLALVVVGGLIWIDGYLPDRGDE